MKGIKLIKGYEQYTIDITGKVFSFRSNKWLKPFDDGAYGYLKYRLYKNKKQKDWSIHRLVGLHFIENPENKPEINHIDSNPKNNHYRNLEWVTHQENMRHAASLGRMKGKCNLVLNLETGIYYESVKSAAETINMKENTLVYKLLGKRKNNTNFIYV